MEKLVVFVYLPNEVVAVPAGIFKYDPQERVGYFSYGRLYLERHAFQISPDLPLNATEKITRKCGGLFGTFRDSSPDYWGRTVFAALNKRPFESIAEHEFLLGASATRIGNLDFRLSLDSPEPILTLPDFSSLDDLLQAFDDINDGKDVPESYRLLLLDGTSMGGMRPKCTVEDDNSLWIAKFPAKGDRYNVAKIEAATMMLAKKAGIRTPEIKIASAGEKDIFLIERFDRAFDITKNGYTRQGFASGLSLLGKDETERGFGYADFAEQLRRSSDTKGAKELFKRMVFNIAVRNTDDHGRNHGFILSDSDYVLSPAYDITPSPSREGLSTSFDLAINVGVEGRFASITNTLSEYQRFGISYEQALILINDVR